MRYVVEVCGRSFEVEVDGERVAVGGRPISVRLDTGAGSAVRRLTRGGVSRAFLVLPGAGRGAWRLSADGDRIDALVLDDRARAVRSAGGQGSTGRGAGTLTAPMPGLVVRVLVAEGAAVAAGQGLVVVEAMKMENELKAAGAGTVRKVHVAPGERVEKGAALLDLA